MANPPVVVVLSLGSGNEPTGDQLLTEIVRLSIAVGCFHVPFDEPLAHERWEHFEEVVTDAELSCVVCYEPIAETDLDVASLSDFGQRLFKLLKAAEIVSEIIFVCDRTCEKKPGGSIAHSTDLDFLPSAIEPFLLPFMRSRPIVLRDGLGRYAAAQLLDRIVATLPAEATGSATPPPIPSLNPTPPGSSSGKRSRRQSAIVAFTQADHAKQRAVDIRRHFEDKIFLRPSPDDLPMEPLNAVGLRFNAAVVASEGESGGISTSLQHQLSRHYALLDTSQPGDSTFSVLKNVRASAYVLVVIDAKFLSDPWSLNLLDFVERTRGNDGSRIFVRDAALSCPSDADWEEHVRPLLEVGLQRLVTSKWPLADATTTAHVLGELGSSHVAPVKEVESCGAEPANTRWSSVRSASKVDKKETGFLDVAALQGVAFLKLRDARVRAAVRRGLEEASPYSSALALGCGMQVRERLGPSLQASSVVLTHGAQGRAAAPDFFFQRLPELSLSGRPMTHVAISHIADGMDHNRSLKSLILDNASLGDASVGAICAALIRDSDPKVELLSLR